MALPRILWLCSLLAALASSARAAEIFRPRVVVVTYFEVGNDTGDRPGELQLWVERDHLDRSVNVPGMSRPVHLNTAGTEAAITIGPGNINPAVNLMALAADPRFDLRQTNWLINGIAGISPADGTVGDAVWTDFVIDGDLVKQIDAREIPADWPDGFFSLDADRYNGAKGFPGLEEDVRTWPATGAYANGRGNVVRLNPALLAAAYALTRNTPLPEDAATHTLRLRYGNQPGTARPPSVLTGANMATETFWHGAKLDAWAHRWVIFETDGIAHLATTAMNDTGTLLALQSLTKQGKADWNRALLLRTASNFDQPPPGTTAAQNLEAEKHGAYTGYLPALEAAYRVGHPVVQGWLSGTLPIKH